MPPGQIKTDIMWEKIKGKLKENWTAWLLLILSGLFASDKAVEYGVFGTEGPGHLPRIEKPAPKKTWQATVWVCQNKRTKTEGLESHAYVDCRQLFEVEVPSLKHPTDEQILAAIGEPVAGLENLIVQRVKIVPPDGWKDEPGSSQPPDDTK